MQSSYDAGYYERIYRDYAAQNPRYKLAFYRERIERHRDRALPRRIHDVGCGPGRFLGFLGLDWERTGSDPSGHAIAEARRLCPEVSFRTASVTQVPECAPFPVVSALDVLEHVPDLDAAGEALEAQLLPGGLLFFVVPVYDGLSGPLIRWLDRDPTHLHCWPRRRWLAWAEARFALRAWGGILRYLLPFGLYVHLPLQTLRWHTPAIWVACTRRAEPRS